MAMSKLLTLKYHAKTLAVWKLLKAPSSYKVAKSACAVSSSFPRCNYSTMYSPKGFSQTKRFHKKDGVPHEFELVYRNPFVNYIQMGQACVILVGACSAALVIFYMLHYEEPINDPDNPRYGPRSKGQMIFAIIALTAFLASLQFICLKCAIRIYTNGKQFVLIRNSFNGISKRRDVFLPGECKQVEGSPLETWNNAAFIINNRMLIILENHFKSEYYLNSMLGKL